MTENSVKTKRVQARHNNTNKITVYQIVDS